MGVKRNNALAFARALFLNYYYIKIIIVKNNWFINTAYFLQYIYMLLPNSRIYCTTECKKSFCCPGFQIQPLKLSIVRFVWYSLICNKKEEEKREWYLTVNLHDISTQFFNFLIYFFWVLKKENRRVGGWPPRRRAAPPCHAAAPRTVSRYNHVGTCLYTPVTTLLFFYWLFWSRWIKKCCSCFVFSYMQLYVLLYKNMFHQLNHMLSVRQPKNMLQQLNLTLFYQYADLSRGVKFKTKIKNES